MNFEPRPYQLALLRRAEKENVIVFLETGSGKTLVAILLINSILDNPSCLKRKCIFVVNQILLVNQQGRVLRESTTHPVGLFHGHMSGSAESWDKSAWESEYLKYDVMVMTAQIFLDHLRHAYVKLGDIGLLVFDECHHARKSHPYNLIMREFYFFTAVEERPKVLGLTASPIAVGVKKGHSEMRLHNQWLELEQNLVSRRHF